MKKVFTILVMALSLSASAQLTETESDLNMKYYDLIKKLQNYEAFQDLPIPEKMTTVKQGDKLEYISVLENHIKFFPNETIEISTGALAAHFTVLGSNLVGYCVVKKDKIDYITYFDENVGFATNKLKK